MNLVWQPDKLLFVPNHCFCWKTKQLERDYKSPEVRNRCVCRTWISWPTKSKETWNQNADLVTSNFMDKGGRWVEKQSLFGSQNCNDVVNRVSTEPWEGWSQTDYEARSVARCWGWWDHSEKMVVKRRIWKSERSNSSFHDSAYFFSFFFSDESLMNPALLFIVERWRMVGRWLRMVVENFWWEW